MFFLKKIAGRSNCIRKLQVAQRDLIPNYGRLVRLSLSPLIYTFDNHALIYVFVTFRDFSGAYSVERANDKSHCSTCRVAMSIFRVCEYVSSAWARQA